MKNYDEDEFKRQYDDALTRNGTVERAVTIGSVVARARDGGWIDPRKKSNIPDWVAELNSEYAWIEQNASIYRIQYRDFIEPARFKTQFDNQVPEGGSKQGKGSAWLKHANRRQHPKLVIRPGEGPVTSDKCLNEWTGYDCQPVRDNVKPFLRLLLRLVPDREARRYVLKWLAHLIQHPDIKMHVSLVFWSHVEGVGKNLLFEAIVMLIGSRHAAVIGQSDLTGDFNGWANRRIFIIGDEVSSSGEKRIDSDKLKGLITGTTVRINEKYQPAREVPNLLNFVFLSNHNDALFLDDHDRRYFVWEIHAAPLPEAMWKAFVHWRDSGGLPALLSFMQHVNTAGFGPKERAPLTEAKQQMIEDNRSDLEGWIADLMTANVSQVIGRELATAHELAHRYETETGRQPPSAKTVVGICKKRGAYARSNQVRLANHKKVRAIAIANGDHWKLRPEADWASEMAKPLIP